LISPTTPRRLTRPIRMRRPCSWWSSGALDEAQSIWGAAAEAGDAEAGNVASEVDTLVKLPARSERTGPQPAAAQRVRFQPDGWPHTRSFAAGQSTCPLDIYTHYLTHSCIWLAGEIPCDTRH
jgi:hypothetical protein